jgi:uncharacterized protein with HEPN domain
VKDDRLYLLHILDSIEAIEQFTRGGRDAFLQERVVQDAVARNLQIIGEAAAKLSDALKSTIADIPWPQVVAFRNRLVHAYWGIDQEIVWDVVVRDLPALKAAVSRAIG